MKIEQLKKFNYLGFAALGLFGCWIGFEFSNNIALGVGNAFLLSSVIVVAMLFGSKVRFKKLTTLVLIVAFFGLFGMAYVEIKYFLLALPLTLLSLYLVNHSQSKSI